MGKGVGGGQHERGWVLHTGPCQAPAAVPWIMGIKIVSSTTTSNASMACVAPLMQAPEAFPGLAASGQIRSMEMSASVVSTMPNARMACSAPVM